MELWIKARGNKGGGGEGRLVSPESPMKNSERITAKSGRNFVDGWSLASTPSSEQTIVVKKFRNLT